MIRSFSLRDLALIRKLSDQGTLLHAESALIKACQPLRGALFSIISRRDSATYVWREDAGDAAGFVQLYLPEDQPHAHLLCLGATPASGEEGPDSGINETAWIRLLDGAVEAVGHRGVHSLIAEVDEDGPELPILRRAGFAVYTRQDIWLSEAPHARGSLAGNSEALLAQAQTVDEWDVEWLYANTVPPLIQLVEPTPPQNGKLLILREDGELTAFVHIQEGPVAAWIQIFIHPNAYSQSNEIIKAALAHCDPDATNVYCCVRRYQSWLQHALVENRFRRCKSQAVMVKHIATPIASKATEVNRLLQGHRAQTTTLLEQLEPHREEQPRLVRDNPG